MSKYHRSVTHLKAGLIAAILSPLLLACSNAKIAGRQDIGTLPASKPSIVYVADFELDAESIQSEPGLLQRPHLLGRGPLGALLPGRLGASDDPALRARELVDLMATSLVKDLGDAGVKARRLEPGESVPSAGWLVRGLFTQVDEGNRLRRAVIGFGEGQTELQLSLAVDDLAQGQPQPFYQLTTDANSGNLPGAAVTLNPIAMGARFVLTRKDLERDVSATAGTIASDLAARVRN